MKQTLLDNGWMFLVAVLSMFAAIFYLPLIFITIGLVFIDVMQTI